MLAVATENPSGISNPSGILAESIYALSVLDAMQHADFTQILRKFYAAFVAES